METGAGVVAEPPVVVESDEVDPGSDEMEVVTLDSGRGAVTVTVCAEGTALLVLSDEVVLAGLDGPGAVPDGAWFDMAM